VKDLLVLLGKRVHELRVGRKWSQEEFAHVSGLHRTYIGQIERGEKNISFANLVKVSGVLGVTMAELLAGLEYGVSPAREQTETARKATAKSSHSLFEVHKLVKTLKLQRAAMDRTIDLLAERARDAGGGGTVRSSARTKLRQPRK
jgi:transcriptional regulator with XRE-family HTH domain